MKTANRKFSRLLACALVFLLALTAAVPVFAAPTKVDQNNLQVVIHNNEGLPGMSTDQFTVYQLFTGTPHKETVAPGTTDNDYDADNWNNYTLADVQWGSSIQGTLKAGDLGYDEGNPDSNKYDHSAKLLETLQALDPDADAWAYDEEGANVFVGVTTAADLAEVLENHNTNDFMQHFAATVADIKDLVPVKVTPTLTEGKDGETDVNAEDYLTYTFTEPGYYMFADTHTPSTTEPDAVSEYIIAVLGDQEINLKASVPDVDKEIVDGDNDTTEGDVAGVGDFVQFKLTGTLPQNFEDFDDYQYIFHDTLSKGLTYVTPDETHPLTVTVDGTEVPMTYLVVLETKNNYTVTAPTTEDGGELTISFADLKTLKATDGSTAITVTADSKIVVTYWARVNKNAVITDAGNPNTVDLEYSNDPNHDGTGKTIEKTVYVYAFGLDLTKVNGSNEPLEGAGFVLKDEHGNYAIFQDQYILTAEDGTQTFFDTKEAADAANEEAGSTGEVSGPVRRLTGWTSETSEPDSTEAVKNLIDAYKDAKKNLDKAKTEEQVGATAALQEAKDELKDYLLEAEEGSKGKIPDVYGLDEGKYFLEEFIVPAGYNTPKEDFDIEIDATIDETTGKLQKVVYTHGEEVTTYSADAGTAEDLIERFHSGLLKDEIENQKAPFLPFTGGIGTLIFYVLGIALIGGAVTYLVIAAKKRKKAEENA